MNKTKTNKYKLLREMLGDNIAEFIAEDLKETYDDLLIELQDTLLDKIKAPMYSFDKDIETKELKKLLEAVKLVHSYYSCDELKDIPETKVKQKTKKEKKYLVDHRCPICSAPASIEQPQESLHAYTTVYDCGTEITKAFGTDDEGIFDKRCDSKDNK